MATKQQKEGINLIDNFAEFKEFKNIDRQTLMTVLKESFCNVIAKMYGTDENYDVIINPDKGDLEIYRNRVVMEARDTCPLISLILARSAARLLPAHLPDTRQLSRATPARSSA